MPRRPGPYSTQVFCNCPFDEQYQPLFHAMIFTIHDCGFVPRCALEVEDSGESRLAKIRSIIEQCGLGVHDISRVQLSGVGLPRFNMPFELGYFLGAKSFGSARQRRKACIIFDSQKYRYQKFLSDISGQDIHSHRNQPARLIAGLRTFLSPRTPVRIPGARSLPDRFGLFRHDLPAMCRSVRIDLDELGFIDHSMMVADWLAAQSEG